MQISRARMLALLPLVALVGPKRSVERPIIPTVIIFISIAMLATGLLIGTFGLGGLNPVEATVPAQVTEQGAGWSVQNFRTISFAAKSWRQLGQEGSCLAFSSLPQRDPDRNDRTRIPAAVTVATLTDEFTFHYPLRGARVLVCAGFTVFLSPLDSGTHRR